MKASAIREHFVSRSDWVDRDNTVDRIIVGDPDKEVGACVVTWISSLAAVRQAIEKGVDLLITHEPTFYNHANELAAIDDTKVGPTKKDLIEQHGLTVLRLHDTWDRWPAVGIPWAWGRFL